MRRILGPGEVITFVSELGPDDKVDTTWNGELRMAGVHVAWVDYTFDNVQPGGRRRLFSRLRLTEGTEVFVE